jgi:hypothetical protein
VMWYNTASHHVQHVGGGDVCFAAVVFADPSPHTMIHIRGTTPPPFERRARLLKGGPAF